MAANETEFPKNLYSLFAPILKAEVTEEICFENLFENIDEDKIACVEWAKFDKIIQGAYFFPEYTEKHKSMLELLRQKIKSRKSSRIYYAKNKAKILAKNASRDK